MKKYNINLEDSSILNFKELYTITVKKAKCIEFKYNFMKTMRESALKKLNCQKKLFMRNNAVIICVDDMFLSYQQLKSVKKLKLKIILNAVIQSQLDDLNSKAEIF